MKATQVFWSLIAVVTVIALVACGGSSTSPPTPPPPADFTLNVSPQSLFVPIGAGSGSLQVSVQEINNFTQQVSVTLNGLPAGVTTTPASPFNVVPGAPQTVVFTVAAGTTPSVSSITANGVSGTLAHSSSFNLSVAAAVYAYVATGYANNPPYGVSGFALDANTGNAIPVATSPFSLDNPPIDMVAVTETGGSFLYVLTQTVTTGSFADTLSSFMVDPASGNLTPVQTLNYQPAGSENSLALHPSGKFLYLVQQSSDCILAYTIDPATGNLTQSSCSTVPAMPNFDAFVLVPPGNFAYGATGDFEGTTEYTYSVNQSDGSLTLVQSADSGDAFNGTLYSDPLGLALYVLLAKPPGLGGCGGFGIWSVDPQSGALTQVNSSFGPPRCVPQSIAFDPADHFAYVTSENSEVIAAGIYAGTVDPSSGNLTNVPGSPFATQSGPFFGNVEPSQGKFFFEVQGPGPGLVLQGYTIDQNTGALTAVTGTPPSLAATFPVKMVVVQPPH